MQVRLRSGGSTCAWGAEASRSNKICRTGLWKNTEDVDPIPGGYALRLCKSDSEAADLPAHGPRKHRDQARSAVRACGKTLRMLIQFRVRSAGTRACRVGTPAGASL